MKKLLSLLMAVVMVASMIVPMTVSAGTYEDGQVIYSNDFTTEPSDYHGFAYDYENAENGIRFSQSLTADGNLRVNVPAEHLVIQDGSGKKGNLTENGGRYSARLALITLDDSVESFTAVFDYTVNAINGVKNYGGVGLIFSDNKETNLPATADVNGEAIENASSKFVWARPGSNTSGAYTTYGGGGSKTNGSGATNGWCTANTSYRIEIYVPSTLEENYADNQCTYKITDKKTGSELTGTFAYDLTRKYKPQSTVETKTLGIYMNGVNVTLEQFTVYNGQPKATFEGAAVSLGTDIGMKFVVDPATSITANLTAEYTLNGKTYTPDAVEKNNMLEYTLTNIAPQNMGDVIVAKLYEGNLIVDSRSFTVAEYLKSLANKTKKANGVDITDAQATLAKDALVYGGAAQNYKNYNTSALVSDGITGSGRTDIGNYAPQFNGEGTNAKITAAGLYFDYANKMYFKFTTNDIANTKVKLGSTTVDAEDIIYLGGNTYKVYTDYYTAAELKDASLLAAVYVDEQLEHSVQYSIYTYISRMQTSATIGDLAMALYNYAESAVALAN